MKHALVMAIAVSSIGATASAPNDQFNLRCKGTTSITSSRGQEAKPYEAIYRIDLTAKKWCERECHATFDIAKLQPTQITLEDKKEDGVREQSFVSNFISRTTGKHFIFSGVSMPSMGMTISIKSEGQCELEEFTGFAAPKTKF